MEEKFLGRRTKVLAKNRQKCGYCDGHHKANVSRWGGEMSHAWNKLFTIIQDPLLDRVSCCARLSLQTVLKDAFMLNNSTTTTRYRLSEGTVRNSLEKNPGHAKSPL